MKTKNIRVILTLIMIMVTAVACCPKQEYSTTDENKAFIKKYYKEVLNTRDVEKLLEFFAPEIEYIRADHKGNRIGIDDFTDCFEMNSGNYGSMNFKIVEMIAESNKVVVRFHVTAMHSGSGGNVEVDGVRVYTIENGKITRKLEMIDDVLLLKQTGNLDSLDYPLRSWN